MQSLVVEAQVLQEELVACRRTLHKNPEVGMELPHTAAFVTQKLEEFGYKPQYVAGFGVTAMVGGKKPGKVILLRADMDALPIKEEVESDFKSTNQNMHACGHDFHTSMLLGAAKLLKAHEDELNGTVKFMFQPAEETLLGAKSMVAAGILENPKVDAAIMFHVASGFPIPAGMLLIPGGGAFSAASDWFEITINGKGGHGAMPEKSVDPLNIIAHLHIALQAIRSRELAGSDNAVITVGQMQGGTTSNVIPDTAMMAGTIRTFDNEVREFIFERIQAIAAGTAQTFRAEAQTAITQGCPSVSIDGQVAADVRAAMIETFGKELVPDLAALGMTKMSGSEDFSFVSQEVPSLMMMLSAGSPEEGYAYPIHHPKAKFDESVLYRGAAAYAAAAVGWLNRNQ